MAGKVCRKLIEHGFFHQPTSVFINTQLVCPICEREIPTAQRDAHHLIPKCKGGFETQFLHRICHRQIHALFTDKELASLYNNVQALLSHVDMKVFVEWVKTKPNSFIERSRKSSRIRPK